MKIANWNVEWMNRWFLPDTEEPVWRASDQIPGVTDIDDLAGRVANVIRAVDADVLTIQEGPSRRAEMQLFVDDYLDGGYDLIGPSGKGQQRLFALVRQGGRAADPRRMFATGKVDLEEPWDVDIDGNLELDAYDFTRDPLLFDVTDQASGRRVRIVNVHLKSKYVHRGERLWNDPIERPKFIEKAVLARRRISAEAMRVRRYLNELLEDDRERPVIVCGDCNDGPGTDHFERFYLTHNLVAALAGNPYVPQLMFRHGFVDRVAKEDNFTAIFDDFIDEVPNRKVLLDHILASPGLYWDLADGRIEHTAFAAEIDENAGDRQRLPSDHRPQSVTF